MKGLDIYLQRMKDGFWGLNPKAANITHLAPNDIVVFYLVGEYNFLGTAVLDSENYKLSQMERQDLWHNKFFTAKNGVRLRDVIVWSKPISIRPIITSLKFIVNPNIWGAYLQGSIRKISLEDFKTITKQGASFKEYCVLRGSAVAPAKQDVATKSTTDMLKVIEE